MEVSSSPEDGLVENSDIDEEYRSCCTEDEEWLDTEESLTECSDECPDEYSLRMFFKGVSVEGSGSGVSGIGVVMERCYGVPTFQVQKKLDFYVEESVAEHLALMDGLLEAMRNGVRRVFAYTDSEEVYNQIAEAEGLEDPLLVALGERIMEHADKLEDFTLKLVCSNKLQRPLRLAQEAVGIIAEPSDADGSVEDCPICCDEKQQAEMVNLNCSHRFCADCMIMYTERKLQTSQVPIRCPQIRCRHCISIGELKDFLPLALYDWLERAIIEARVLNLERIYCPFPNCSMLLNRSQSLSSQASSSSQSDINCIVCPECNRFICVSCGVPWHSSMSCEEYQNLPADERDAGDIILHQLAQNNRWRRCQQCRQMIELTQGCYHMTCWWCGHEFCYSCGAEYREGAQTCQCAFWDDDIHEPSVTTSNQESEEWRWETFDTLPAVLDAYSEQERAQLALVQRFLAGGYGLSDHHPCQSPPRCSDSYVDTIKDLHQLPWLERFVSVISDNYQENFIQ